MRKPVSPAPSEDPRQENRGLVELDDGAWTLYFGSPPLDYCALVFTDEAASSDYPVFKGPATL